MFSVLLVDDEPWILIGLQNNFRWQKYGFAVVSTCGRLAEAEKFIELHEPDVVFIDIRVAGDNGIELIASIRNKGLDTEFVIISGHPEFAIAQSAIRLNVFDFLLKPIKYDDEFLFKLNKYLHEKVRKHDYQDISTITEINHGKMTMRGFLDLHPTFGATDFLRVISVNDISKQQLNSLSLPTGISLKTGHKKYIWITRDTPNFERDFTQWYNEAGSRPSMGISKVVPGGMAINIPTSQAEIALLQRFVTLRNDVYFYTGKRSNLTESLLSRYLYAESSDRESMAKGIDRLFLEIKHHNLNIQDICTIYNRIIQLLGRSGVYSDFILEEWNFSQIADNYQDLDHMAQELQRILYDEHIDDIPSNNVLYNKMLMYIHENYHRDSSLSSLAANFNLSLSYTSELFSKNAGKSFSKYVSEMKVSRAQELLISTDLSIQEIAELSGYNDYFYFCKQFKKLCHKTPTTFRTENRVES